MRQVSAYDRRGVLLGTLATLSVLNGSHAETPSRPGDAGAPPNAGDVSKRANESPKGTSPPQNLEELSPHVAVAILGKKARDASGHDMGPVVDVLVGRDGLPRAAVIDFGGFLGVGSRKIAIDWALLQFNPDDADAPVGLALDRAMVQAAPEYKPTAQRPIEIVGPSQASGGSNPTDGK